MLAQVSTARAAIVGRHHELDLLDGWVDDARGGHGRLVLCAGEPGIGKTRLAQELAGRALSRGVAVVWARCAEAEGAPAFWPWRQVLRALGVDAGRVLAGDGESAEERFRVLDEIAEALRTAGAGGGLVVVVDDVHRGDEPSLQVLRHVAPQLPEVGVLLVAAYRAVEPGRALAGVLPDLLRAPAVERLDLRGFDLDEVREQLRGTPGAVDEHARTVLDATGGNPLFVRELARAIADGTWRSDRPPRTVLDVVAARLAGVGAEARGLVTIAAIVGRDFSLDLVAAALARPVEACAPLLDEVVGHGLVEEVGPGRYRFVHALTRDAVEASLSTAERAAGHRASRRSPRPALPAISATTSRTSPGTGARSSRSARPPAPGTGPCGPPPTRSPASHPRRASGSTGSRSTSTRPSCPRASAAACSPRSGGPPRRRGT